MQDLFFLCIFSFLCLFTPFCKFLSHVFWFLWYTYIAFVVCSILLLRAYALLYFVSSGLLLPTIPKVGCYLFVLSFPSFSLVQRVNSMFCPYHLCWAVKVVGFTKYYTSCNIIVFLDTYK